MPLVEITNMPELKVKSINALSRGLKVLQVIQNLGAVSLSDLHHQTGYPKASLLRILKTLMEEGVVWQRIVDNAYLASYSLRERARIINREQQLIEMSSSRMEALCDSVKWPSVLAVPRLDCMEVIETNAPRAYFSGIPLGPIGFRISMLRSASGRTYLAFCDEEKRETILNRLRKSNQEGNRLAQFPELVTEVLEKTREQGFSFRDHEFGGHFNKPRHAVDDGRDSIAMPIVIGSHVPGVINLTWTKKVLSRQEVVERYHSALKSAVDSIADALAHDPGNFSW